MIHVFSPSLVSPLLRPCAIFFVLPSALVRFQHILGLAARPFADKKYDNIYFFEPINMKKPGNYIWVRAYRKNVGLYVMLRNGEHTHTWSTDVETRKGVHSPIGECRFFVCVASTLLRRGFFFFSIIP